MPRDLSSWRKKSWKNNEVILGLPYNIAAELSLEPGLVLLTLTYQIIDFTLFSHQSCESTGRVLKSSFGEL